MLIVLLPPLVPCGWSPSHGYGRPGKRVEEGARVQNEAQWEQHARWWQRQYTDGADPEYEEQILPLVARHVVGARRLLDVGCGEGQIARRIAAQGTAVVGLDPTGGQVATAVARGGGPRFARARAEALPCRDGAFDTVVVCLALEHVDRFELAIDEVARVLEPGGRFVLVLCHPLLQAPGSAWIDDRILDERYWRVGAYLAEVRAFDEVAPGVDLLFIHRPLSRYVHAMGAAGLLIEDMVEEAPPTSLVAEHWGFPEAASIPRVLLVQAVRSGA
jgi:SAM-dependent methyltransferase